MDNGVVRIIADSIRMAMLIEPSVKNRIYLIPPY